MFKMIAIFYSYIKILVFKSQTGALGGFKPRVVRFLADCRVMPMFMFPAFKPSNLDRSGCRQPKNDS